MPQAPPTPDTAGFGEAQERKRLQLGSDLIFLGPSQPTWPAGTAINPDTGDPYDPVVVPESETRSRTKVRCGVFFKAVNRGGAAQAALGSPAGWGERTRIFAIAPISAKAIIEQAVAFIYHDQEFKIDVVKVDDVVLGYSRMLIYAAAKGN